MSAPLDRELDNPENLPIDDVRRVRDEIRVHVEALLASLEKVPA